MEQLQINKTNAINAYKVADSAGRQLLESLLGKEIFNQKITERVRTFEDACAVEGIDPQDEKFTSGTPDDIAYQKLKVIIRVLNEGWTPDWSNANQRKWYAWFEYTTSGFRFNDAYCGYTVTDSAGGSRLCFHSQELATYAAKQFVSEYNQFLK